MKLNKNTNGNSQNIFNRNKKEITSGNYQNLRHLYPYGHRVTHQMRWFKGSRDRGLKSDIAS